MEAVRAIPAIHTLLAREDVQPLLPRFGRRWTVWALQRAAEQARRQALERGAAPTAEEIVGRACALLERLFSPSLRPVINATGVAIHTNLGRAPLPAEAVEALVQVAGSYSNLEYDLDRGQRGSRQAHVEGLLCALTGAEAALVVNNNAAAVLLVLAALAAGRKVIVSRGELVEIGDGFRIPEILAQSGARLCEVGTTNRTHLSDYQRALDGDVALLLKVHRSNYRLVGFTAEVDVAQLAQLGRRHGIPVVCDLGSGALLPLPLLRQAGEPIVGEVLQAGADLVCFSGDKLLGGPQAGVILGRRSLVEACRRHPLARAVRIDKLCLAALEAVLRLYLQPERAVREVPVLAMLTEEPERLRARAEELARRLAQDLPGWQVRVEEGHASQAGGGSLPGVELPTAVVALRGPLSAAEAERRLRAASPPVIARIHREQVLLDLRTVLPHQDALLARQVAAALSAGS